VFPAVETAAQMRAAIIDRASRGAEVHAFPVLLRGKKKNRIAGIGVRADPNLVGLHGVTLRRMQKERLIAPAAFDTTPARDFRLFD
jgi:hypothetical protein